VRSMLGPSVDGPTGRRGHYKATMANDRPKIPADIQRRVLVEAGHRCAIPSCRQIVVDIHHIVPWATRRKHEYENLIALCPICHRRAGSGEIDQKSLRIYKANLRYTHDRFSQFEVDVLFGAYALRDGPTDQPMVWPPYLYLLIKRLLDAGYVEIQPLPQATFLMHRSGLQFAGDVLAITVKCVEYIDSLGLEWKDDLPPDAPRNEEPSAG